MKIICLMGPTSSGKTDLAIELTQHFPCDIISVDSAMVYRGMDIGTAKPDHATLTKAPHRLINIRDPLDTYSVGQFCQEALQEITHIHAQGRIPLLVGGTMLYFHGLQQGLSSLPTADAAIRMRITEEANQAGWAALHQKLHAIDPDTAQKIHPQDTQRIQRALEIYELTEKKPSQIFFENQRKKLHGDVINIILSPSMRPQLHQRIEDRFKKMINAGFIEEVDVLLKRGDITEDTPALRAVGYRQVWRYLSGKISREDMALQAIAATRQLAKRQLTWLRQWEGAARFDSEATDLISQVKERINFF